MRHGLIVIILASATTGAIAQGSSNSEIAAFAKDICDEIRPQGMITKLEIEGKLEGSASGVAKLIGLSVGADGKVRHEKMEYAGVPLADVAQQMKDARECRLALTKVLIDERNRLARTTAATALTYGDFAEAMSGGKANKACGYGRDTRRQSCVSPRQPGGQLVPGTIAAIGLERNGVIVEWYPTTDNEQLACIELRASTRACETLVRIKARAVAVEVFPRK